MTPLNMTPFDQKSIFSGDFMRALASSRQGKHVGVVADAVALTVQKIRVFKVPKKMGQIASRFEAKLSRGSQPMC